MGAGIGGGYQKEGREITISGGTVRAVSSSRYAGAGIGGGSVGAGADITVSGGSVFAWSDAWDLVINGKTVTQGMGGAGIGGGKSAKGTGFRFTGGAVCARSSRGGAAIGDGAYYEKVQTDLGNGMISETYRISAGAEAETDGWTALVFRNGALCVDSVNVAEPLVLPEGTSSFSIGPGQTVTLAAEGSLTIPAGAVLRNNGTIRYRGTVCPVEPLSAVYGNQPVRVGGGDIETPEVPGS